jgi:hypothetical protein
VTTKVRGIEDWKKIVEQMLSLESGSRLAAESRVIGAHELKAAMAIVEKNIEDVALRRKISALFMIRTKYEALHEIIGKHLADDPECACELAEAAAGIEVMQGGYAK